MALFISRNFADIKTINRYFLFIIVNMSFPAVVFSGKIDKIYSVLERESRTMKVRVNLDNTGEMLRPGMFASVRVSLPCRRRQ